MGDVDPIAVACEEVLNAGFLDKRMADILRLIASRDSNPIPSSKELSFSLQKNTDGVLSDLSKLRRRLKEYFQGHKTLGQPFTISKPPYRLVAAGPAVDKVPDKSPRSRRWLLLAGFGAITIAASALFIFTKASPPARSTKASPPARSVSEPPLTVIRPRTGQVVPRDIDQVPQGTELQLEVPVKHDNFRYLLAIDAAGNTRVFDEAEMSKAKWGWQLDESPPMLTLLLVSAPHELNQEGRDKLIARIRGCGKPGLGADNSLTWDSELQFVLTRRPKDVGGVTLPVWVKSVEAVLTQESLGYYGVTFGIRKN